MKRTLFIILVVFFILPLTSCGRHTPDTNGANNFSLETITLDDMLETGTKCIEQGAFEKRKGNTVSVNVKKFSGIKTLHNFKLNSAVLNLAVDVRVASGNLKVILCTENEILKEFFVNKGTQRVTLSDITDNVYLKVAGESANYNLVFDYDVEMSKGIVI